MSFNQYFHDELTSLRELGKEFSLRNPKLAPFLAEEAQDPDVERLLEGVAFLTGRLRQKLDDEFPELTHSLMGLLWPSFLKPVPAMTVVQFDPIISLPESQRIKKGIEVASKPVDSTSCVFQTCYDVELNPLEITKVQRIDRTEGTRISISLALTSSISLDELGLERLRFFLHGESHVAQTLYLWFFRYLNNIKLSIVNQEDTEFHVATLDSSALSPVGFGDTESLLPHSNQLFKGYRLIQEYFTLPEKFHFVELNQLNALSQAAAGDVSQQHPKEINIEFDFSRRLDSFIAVSDETFRLHCSPVVNLFNHSARPIRLDHRQCDYRVVPEGEQPEHYEVYDISHVEGWGSETREYRTYRRFESFEHANTIDKLSDNRYFRERLSPSLSGFGVDVSLSFVDGRENIILPEVESLSIDLICSNRHLPSMLSVGDLNVPTGTSPEFASFENIIPVTPSFTPPLDQGFHWRLIANMSLNYMSLCNLDAIRTILTTYDYRAFYDRQQARASQHRINGLESIMTESVERFFGGVPIRGLHTKLCIKESCFSNEGDMYLFLTVLNEFFALYSSINSFHRLEVHGLENGEVYRWTPRLGQQPLI